VLVANSSKVREYLNLKCRRSRDTERNWCVAGIPLSRHQGCAVSGQVPHFHAGFWRQEPSSLTPVSFSGSPTLRAPHFCIIFCLLRLHMCQHCLLLFPITHCSHLKYSCFLLTQRKAANRRNLITRIHRRHRGGHRASKKDGMLRLQQAGFEQQHCPQQLTASTRTRAKGNVSRRHEGAW